MALSYTPRRHSFSNRGVHKEDLQICVRRRVFDQHSFDRQYGYKSVVKTDVSDESKLKKVREGCCRTEMWLAAFLSLLPILHWGPRYDARKNAVADIIAGITVGIMHIPQGMAYASLASLPPVYGLYTSFFPSITYFFVGTSGHISLGTLAIISLMVGSVNNRLTGIDSLKHNANSTNYTADFSTEGPDSVTVITCLSLTTGVILVLMSMLRLGFLSVYLSDQLVSGYTTGAAVMVFTAQVDKVLGVAAPLNGGLFKLYYVYEKLYYSLPDVNIASLVISGICILVIYLVKEFVNDRYKKRLIMPIPIDLFVIIVATVVSYYCALNLTFGVAVVGHIPTGLPVPRLPPVSLISQLLTDAFTLAIILYALTVSMAKIFAKRHKYRVDANQELFAYGVVSIVNSFFSAWPAGSSLSRSSVQDSAGAKSQFTGIISSFVVLIVLLWLAPMFEQLPKCVLAAIIIVALKSMFMQLMELKELWLISKIDFSIWLFCFLATVISDVTIGLAASVIFSVATVVFRSQRPPTLLLGKIPETDLYRDLNQYSVIEELTDVKIFRFDSPVYFANAELFRTQLYRFLRFDPQEIRERQEQLEKYTAKDTDTGSLNDEERQMLKDVNVNSARNSTPICDANLRRHSVGPCSAIIGCRLPLYRRDSAPDNTNDGEVHGHYARNKKYDHRGAAFSHSAHKIPLNYDESPMASPVADECFSHSAGENNAAVFLPTSTVSFADPPEKLLRQVSMQSLALERNPELPHHIIIDCSGFNYVDVMGATILKQIYLELVDIGVALFFASCKPPVLAMFESTKFYVDVPKSCLFLSVEDAVVTAKFHQKTGYRFSIVNCVIMETTAESDQLSPTDT